MKVLWANHTMVEASWELQEEMQSIPFICMIRFVWSFKDETSFNRSKT